MGTLSSTLLGALFGLAIVAAMGLMFSGVSNNPSYSPAPAQQFGVEDKAGEFANYSVDLTTALQNIQSSGLDVLGAAGAAWSGSIAIFSLLLSSVELFTDMLSSLLIATGIPFPTQVSAILMTLISLWVIFQIIKLVIQSDF